MNEQLKNSYFIPIFCLKPEIILNLIQTKFYKKAPNEQYRISTPLFLYIFSLFCEPDTPGPAGVSVVQGCSQTLSVKVLKFSQRLHPKVTENFTDNQLCRVVYFYQRKQNSKNN